MPRFLIKLTIFSLPILIFVGYVLYSGLILPVDYFTFRAWEALSVYEKTPTLSGPFYPSMHLVKKELGDLSGLTKLPVAKNVEWFTDQYGYRRKKSNTERFDVVIIGDSSTVGSSLTQEDIFSEVLGSKTGLSVYPYAPSNFNKFLEEKRFRDNPPDIVIVESVEKLVLGLSEIIPKDQKKVAKRRLDELSLENIIGILGFRGKLVTSLPAMRDRLKKEVFINYLRARLAEIPKYIREPGFRVRRPGKVEVENVGKGVRSEMVFYSEPEEYFKDWKESDIKRVIFTLNQYKEKLSETNTKLVFMPIPNKENIYWRQVKGGKAISNLKRLIDAAESAGISTVDLWTVYNNLYNQNPDKLFYHTDDTHWNAYGVEIAARETVRKLKEIENH